MADRPALPSQTQAPRRASLSLRIVRVLGVDVRVHISFLLLVALVLVARDPEVASVGAALGWLAALFACVVVHELAHSVTARRRGIPVREITLLPIGGVSRLEKLPDNPSDELAIAIAGPLASFALGALAAVAVLVTGGRLVPIDLVQGSILVRLAWFNVILGAFNLLPAFPLDGGRVLRAWLERRMDLEAATRQAAKLGRIIAIALAVVGVLFNFWLLFIAVFVYLGASAEATATLVHVRLQGRRVGDVMLLQPHVLEVSQPIAEVAPFLRRTAQREFPAVDHGAYRGLVTADALEIADPAATVAAGVVDLPTLSPGDDVETAALAALQESPFGALAVAEAGRVVGLLRMGDIQHLVQRPTVSRK
jgi:stage IV sporulation protein FB